MNNIKELESFAELISFIKRNNYSKIFLVTGKSSFDKNYVLWDICLLYDNFNIKRYSNFSSNPNIKELDEGSIKMNQFNPDLILAIGGGSVIDYAKAISVYDKHNIKRLLTEKNWAKRRKTLISIPTTCGTGSETTQFCTIYQDGIKASMDHTSLLPDAFLLNPKFIAGIPKQIMASTGADAFCQAIESYWSIKSTSESRLFAKQAISLIWNNLYQAINSQNDKNCYNLLKGANLAGKAINITRTTAAHSLSYPMTSRFGIPHGTAVSLTLGSFFTFNEQTQDNDCNDSRGAVFVKKRILEIKEMLNIKRSESAEKVIEKFFSNLSLLRKLRNFNIKQEDIEIIINEGFTPDRVKNNPRKVSILTAKKILKNIF
jgi:alcohol dehydrogenase